MTYILIGIGIGFVAGILSGLFGIGGGTVIVPALVLLGLTQHQATGTSLAALLMPVGVLAVFQYAHRHEVRVTYAIGIALGLTIGALFGAKFAGRISDVTLTRAFGGLLLVVSIRFLVARA
ncbi:MAG: sulfite exporter TauE/SafE family protein [Actinomycetota bacterium]